MTPRAIEIVAADGCALRGQIWSGGADWIVLFHDVGPEEDLDRWRPLVPALLAEGLSVLAVDLRGHGASDGEWDDGEAVADVVAAIRLARASGARFVVAVAAGVSAENALWAVEQETVDGVVVLSAMLCRRHDDGEGLPCAQHVQFGRIPRLNFLSEAKDLSSSALVEKRERVPRGSGTPKLFIVGANDMASRETTDALRRASIGWAAAVTLPTSEHGTELLRGAWLGHVCEQIRGFVRERRYLARSGVKAKGEGK